MENTTESFKIVIELKEDTYFENEWTLGIELLKGEKFINSYNDGLLFSDDKFELQDIDEFDDENSFNRSGVETLLSLCGDTTDTLLSRFSEWNSDGKLKTVKIVHNLIVGCSNSEFEVITKD